MFYKVKRHRDTVYSGWQPAISFCNIKFSVDQSNAGKITLYSKITFNKSVSTHQMVLTHKIFIALIQSNLNERHQSNHHIDSCSNEAVVANLVVDSINSLQWILPVKKRPKHLFIIQDWFIKQEIRQEIVQHFYK